MNGNTQNVVGTSLGGVFGLLKGFTLFTFITWSVALETFLMGAIGALGGLVLTTLYKLIIKQIKK